MGMAGYTVALMMIGVIISPCLYGKEFSDHQEIKVQRLLKRLNKHALISINSEDGDIIDCVPIHSQPAFDHPLLKNHTIQMRPSFIPESTSTYTKKKINATQVWNKNGRCPINTVPIRRIKKEDILRSKSIENFGKKTMTPGILLYGSSSVLEDDPSIGHEYAVMNAMNGLYFGTQFSVNIWKPQVQVRNEFSLAQTWLSSGAGTALNTIEAGLQVYPGKYGDNNVRLFVYWTADGYQRTGCYNTDCPGFVQRSSLVTVGGAYTTVSEYNGNQYELSMLIWKGLIVEAKDKGVEIATAVGKQMLEKNVFIFGAVDYDEASTTEKLHQSISYRTHLCGVLIKTSETEIEEFIHLDMGNEVDLSSMHKQSIEYAEAKKSTMKMLRCRRNSGDWGRKAHSGRERVDGREG
ncbi:unnamed protein product [Brassica napus]|uniref:(rape) hypothetical protein n=1 Tax=Brassica napus TaxID=3708 RepID=A0A816J8S6_BRANA|nr:unnamed protein product [Brassica napus]